MFVFKQLFTIFKAHCSIGGIEYFRARECPGRVEIEIIISTKPRKERAFLTKLKHFVENVSMQPKS
jgi:hypothetical protein